MFRYGKHRLLWYLQLINSMLKCENVQLQCPSSKTHRGRPFSDFSDKEFNFTTYFGLTALLVADFNPPAVTTHWSCEVQFEAIVFFSDGQTRWRDR